MCWASRYPVMRMRGLESVAVTRGRVTEKVTQCLIIIMHAHIIDDCGQIVRFHLASCTTMVKESFTSELKNTILYPDVISASIVPKLPMVMVT